MRTFETAMAALFVAGTKINWRSGCSCISDQRWRLAKAGEGGDADLERFSGGGGAPFPGDN